MLKNIKISKYFGLIRHEMELDDKLWKRNDILSNMEEGFKIIKCTSRIDCNEIAVALNKDEKIGICEGHLEFYNSTHGGIIEVPYGEEELRNELIKLEKYIIHIEERKDYLRTNSVYPKLGDKNQKIFNDLYSKNKKKIKAIQSSLSKFSKSGEPEHYFFIKDTIVLIQNISWEIIGKIAEFLHEPSLKSLVKAIQNENDEYSYEKSKAIKDQIPFPDDLYEKSLDLFTFNYILTRKVKFLQNLIQNLYDFAKSKSKENKVLKAVWLILFFTL